jgi:hypothetical protein
LGLSEGISVLADEAKITAYGVRSFEEPGALQNVLIGDKGPPDRKEDIQARSPIVGAIKEERLVRLYVPDASSVQRLDALWKETVR